MIYATRLYENQIITYCKTEKKNGNTAFWQDIHPSENSLGMNLCTGASFSQHFGASSGIAGRAGAMGCRDDAMGCRVR